MDEATRQSALMSALTTEHFVLQTAASSTISEASARSSLYVLSLSSSLVAMGFTAQSRDVFIPFVASVIPAVFLLGLFTVARASLCWPSGSSTRITHGSPSRSASPPRCF